MGTLYKITDDLLAINNLMENAVDENGEPRELTEEETEYVRKCFTVSYDEFKDKFDNYCRFIKNLKIESADVDAERKNYKDELDRLSKRSKAFANRAECVQNMLRWCMDTIKCQKYKTELFSAGVQNTQLKVEALAGEKLDTIPDVYLKPRELDTTAIKQAIKDGLLIQKDGPENYGKLFVAKTGEALKGVGCVQGTALVIR